MAEFNHESVLPNEVINALQIQPSGVYVDCTLGGGGHSALICQQLTAGRLIGIDRDENAIIAATKKINSPSFTAVRGNFHDFEDIMRELGIKEGALNGVLLDLGVSSHQIDAPERGFSFRHDGPLDMRMDTASPLTAKQIINEYSEKELVKIFFEYGEERFSRKIARRICQEREIAPIETTSRLAAIIEKSQPFKPSAPHPAMRTFMALRIAVNNELSPLGAVLQAAVGYLAPNGRIAVISFHSLEDRIVKATFAKLASPCECPRDIPYCVCGKTPTLRLVTRKPIVPTAAEVERNKRSHSAKLRVGERV
ncbi:MAG: 16S rRNA (cytosine(1402)-N(4))-methyltransferase RsmH [Defluviitaleaceae bacterium]|nr:16S rRNA (cytosine(1402)-N(4))-methyltransferase RsmH [Defluviitaleaceae bacterium]